MAFVAALSEYDQVLPLLGYQNLKTNLLKGSVNLFHSVLRYQNLIYTPVILYLNKKDLLMEKIKGGNSPVQNYFPGCNENDYEGVVNYFRHLYLEQNPNPGERNIYAFETCAIDTDDIRAVYNDVQSIVSKSIKEKINIQ